MEPVKSVIDSGRQVPVRQPVIAVFQVEVKVGDKFNAVVAHHVAESHERLAFKAVERIVPCVPVHQIGCEVKLILARNVIAFLVFGARNVKLR